MNILLCFKKVKSIHQSLGIIIEITKPNQYSKHKLAKTSLFAPAEDVNLKKWFTNIIVSFKKRVQSLSFCLKTLIFHLSVHSKLLCCSDPPPSPRPSPSLSLWFTLLPHVNLSGLVYFAASCYSNSKVTPPRGLGLFHLPPYVLTLSSYIYLPPHTFSACERCHMGTKIMPAPLYK